MAQRMSGLEKFFRLRSTIVNWPLVLIDKLGLKKLNEYHTRSGIKILCRSKSTDINEAVIVFSGLEYPKKYLKIKDDDVVIDLGANIGAFSLFFDQVNYSKKYTGYAFEPFTDNAVLLQKNLTLNKLKKFKIVETAISSVNGYVNLNTNTNYDSISISNTGGLRVKSSTLSSFCQKNNITHIDLLKMDVEGSEYEIIDTDYKFIKDHIKKVILEFHKDERKDLNWILKKTQNDFHFTIIHNENSSGVILLTNNKPEVSR